MTLKYIIFTLMKQIYAKVYILKERNILEDEKWEKDSTK